MEKRRTCFVIGPIGMTGSETRKAADYLLNGIIKPAIESFLSIRVWRADEDNQPGMITDKLITDLFDSDLVIADLSELNPNAFYELGIRHAAEKPTIHMAATGTKLPFDNLGHRAIFFDRNDWHSIEAARKALADQCEEALATDFRPSNPVVQALSVKAFRASPRKEEHILADIMERLESIESKQSSPALERSLRPVPADNAQLSRRYKLEQTLKNYARSDIGKKLKLTDDQISNYASTYCSEGNFRQIMNALQAGDIEAILNGIPKGTSF